MRRNRSGERIRREWGRLLDVSEREIGRTIAADAASGADELVVTNGAMLADVRWLSINGQVTAPTGWDDDTSTLSLADPLTAAAYEGDRILVWSKNRNEVLVDLVGLVDRDDVAGEPLPCMIDQGLAGALPVGPRLVGEGEDVQVEYDPDDDEWTLVKAPGLARSSGVKFEADDFHSITLADLAAGVAVIDLSQHPIDESVILFWGPVPQEPTEYTVDADAQTVTVPLSAAAKYGHVLWVHYAYRPGLAKQTGPIPFTVVGASMGHGFNWTSIPWPTGTENPDLFVFAQLARSAATNTCSDGRATRVTTPGVPSGDFAFAVDTAKIWVGNVTDKTVPLAAAATDLGGVQEDVYGLLVLRPETPIAVDLNRVGDSGAQGTGAVPGLDGSGSGAVGVGFSAAGIGGTSAHSWGSPWSGYVAEGSYGRISFVTQSLQITAATPAITSDSWRGLVLGLGEG